MVHVTQEHNPEGNTPRRLARVLELVPTEGSIVYQRLEEDAAIKLQMRPFQIAGLIAELCTARDIVAESSSGFTFLRRAPATQTDFPLRQRPPAPLARRRTEARR